MKLTMATDHPSVEHPTARIEAKENHEIITQPAISDAGEDQHTALEKTVEDETVSQPAEQTVEQNDEASEGEADNEEAVKDESSTQLEVDTAFDTLRSNSVTSSNDQKLSSQSTSLLTSPTIVEPHSEDPIEAIDALEDAIEEMGKILPKVPLSPEKAVRKTPTKAPVTTTATKHASLLLASKTQKAPATKAPVSKATLPKPKTPSSLLKTTQPSAVARITSVRSNQPTRVASASTLAAKRQTMVSSKKADAPKQPSSPPTDYLASKRRPISMQFPPPPQRSKSTKAPTKPTFTLPGEAITARKKAQLEEKLKKEQEELEKKRQFKARPAPNVAKARPASMIVKQTASSRARLSVADGLDGNSIGRRESTSPANTGLKRSNTTAVAPRSGATKITSTAEKRMTVTERAAKASANTAVKRGSTAIRSLDPLNSTLKRASVAANRMSMSMSTSATSAARKFSAPRPKSMMLSSSHAPSSGVKPSAEESLVLRQKAKDIYNRDRVEKESREREKREKEEAAKKARLNAAEKGRQASREWAEKQKKRVVDAKLAQQQKQPAQIPV
jgi:hypothetical protein